MKKGGYTIVCQVKIPKRAVDSFAKYLLFSGKDSQQWAELLKTKSWARNQRIAGFYLRRYKRQVLDSGVLAAHGCDGFLLPRAPRGVAYRTLWTGDIARQCGNIKDDIKNMCVLTLTKSE